MNMLWLLIAFMASGGVLSRDSPSFQHWLKERKFDCELDIKDGNWTIKCTTDAPYRGELFDFRGCELTLCGVLNPESSTKWGDLLNSSSPSENNWYCQRPYSKEFIYSELKPETIAAALKEASVTILKLSNASDPNDLMNISPQFPRLRQLEITDYSLPELSTLPPDPKSSINYLDLRNNNIESIADGIFIGFPRLKTLHLLYNRLKAVKKNLFHGINDLKKLDLSHNLIESLPSDVFSNLHSLEKIILNNNHLTLISGELFLFNRRLYQIDISNNDLKYLPPTLFHNLSNLETIYCDNCGLFDLDKDAFLNSPNLFEISFNYNNFNFLRGSMYSSLKSLFFVRFRGNNISSLYETLSGEEIGKGVNDTLMPVFKGAPKIIFLDLGKNKIELLEDRQIIYLTNLQYLILDHNKIAKVELGYHDPIKLDELDLSYNYITEFNVNWQKPVDVRDLNVDYNLLTSLNLPLCYNDILDSRRYNFSHNNISTVNIYSWIKIGNPIEFHETLPGCDIEKHSVDLSHNPLLCDCDVYPFYQYINAKSPTSVLHVYTKEGFKRTFIPIRRYQLPNIEKLTCADPPFLRNLSVLTLTEDAFDLPCPITSHHDRGPIPVGKSGAPVHRLHAILAQAHVYLHLWIFMKIIHS